MYRPLILIPFRASLKMSDEIFPSSDQFLTISKVDKISSQTASFLEKEIAFLSSVAIAHPR